MKKIILAFCIAISIPTPAEGIESVGICSIDEVVDADIDALTIREAVDQLIMQNGKSNQAIRHLKIDVDEGFRKVSIKFAVKDVSLCYVLRVIAMSTNGVLDYSKAGDIRIRRVLDGGEVEKNIFIGKSVIARMGISLKSVEEASQRLDELSVPVRVIEVNEQLGCIRVCDTGIVVNRFELLVKAIAASGLDLGKAHPSSASSPKDDAHPANGTE